MPLKQWNQPNVLAWDFLCLSLKYQYSCFFPFLFPCFFLGGGAFLLMLVLFVLLLVVLICLSLLFYLSSNRRIDASTLSPSFLEIRGLLNKFPDFFRMGTFIDSTHNYRGITFTSIAAKIYNALLRNRIEPKIDNILRKNQNGLRRNRSTTSQILTIRRIVEGVRAKNIQATLLFVDFTKAFDSIHRGKMEQILLAYGLKVGVRGVMVIVVEIGHDDTSSDTRLIAFHIALIPLGKVWIQLFSLQLWVNSRTD